MMDSFLNLENQIGYNFKNKKLLLTALTHKSFNKSVPISEDQTLQSYQSEVNNERLEFLGDAVLDLVLSDLLMTVFPKDSEGDLTKKRASLVNEMTLNNIALNVQLDSYLKLGKAEIDSGLNKNSRLLSSCLEALIGAIYLDSGLESVRIFIKNIFELKFQDLMNGIPLYDDYKTQLQELLQKKYHIIPEYHLINTVGPEHQKIFEIEVKVQGKVVASATGKSKKIAEQNAAKKALEVNSEL